MARKANQSTLPTVLPQKGGAVVPWSDKAKSEKLSELVDLSLEQNRRILSLEFDPDDRSQANLKLISIISNVALQIISQQGKLDRATLQSGLERLNDAEFYERFGQPERDAASKDE